MVASAEFSAFLDELFAPVGQVTYRRMFGKTGVFCSGVMLGMIRENVLYLRVDDHSPTFFQEAAASPPLNYEKGGHAIDLAFWRSGACRTACLTSRPSLRSGLKPRSPLPIGSPASEHGPPSSAALCPVARRQVA